MWTYHDYLLYPVNITQPNLDIALMMVNLIGGYSGELGAALRYLNQAKTMPTENGVRLLTDIGTEEMAHVEILSEMIHQLVKDATIDEIKESPLLHSYVENRYSFKPTNMSGNPFTVDYYASTGDPITDLYEDLAAEQKARSVYENIMNLTDDKDVLGPLSFLREREIIHFNRFKDLLDEYLKAKNKS